jgi:AcrR family transcriptional regulator
VPSRSYHRGNLPQAILDESRRLIEAEGLGSFSLAAVARALGVSSGAPYHHFKDADEVLRCVAEQAFARVLDSVRSAVQSRLTAGDMDAEAVRKAITIMCHELLQYSIDHPVLFRMAVTDYRPQRESESFQFIGGVLREELVASSGLVDAGRAAEFGAAVYVMLRGLAAVAEEAPRLVPQSGEPHVLLDQLLDALFLAFRPSPV